MISLRGIIGGFSARNDPSQTNMSLPVCDSGDHLQFNVHLALFDVGQRGGVTPLCLR